VGAVRFVFDGHRLNTETTPAEMGMQDGDCVDCLITQVGGGGRAAAAAAL